MLNNYRFRKNINDSEDIFPSPYLHSMFFNNYRFRNIIFDSEDIYPPSPYLHSMTLTSDKDQYHFDHKKMPWFIFQNLQYNLFLSVQICHSIAKKLTKKIDKTSALLADSYPKKPSFYVQILSSTHWPY